MAGYLLINGAFAASWAITVTKVVVNSDWNDSKDTAAVHPKFKELPRKRPIKKIRKSKKSHYSSDSNYSAEDSDAVDDSDVLVIC